MKWYSSKAKFTYAIVGDEVLCKRDDEISLRPSSWPSSVEEFLRFLKRNPHLGYYRLDVELENK